MAIFAGILCCLSSPVAFALTESEVQEQVESVGRETVSGNVFIWFLCAIAFLKVSQKIDSFLGSLGINVGHTGGSMMAEAIIAARGVSSARSFAGRGNGIGSSGKSAASQGVGFMKGGLAGVASRGFTAGAVKNATGVSSGGIGGAAFTSSMAKGGAMANNVIGTVAAGSMATMGSMTGESASQALTSYLGYAALGEGAENVPTFSNVEIGGGRISGIETSQEHPTGSAFAMYHADQFTEPSREYTSVTAADGTKWYRQYTQDAVEKSPYMASDGSIADNEQIVKKLPDPPRRKGRI